MSEDASARAERIRAEAEEIRQRAIREERARQRRLADEVAKERDNERWRNER